MKKIMILLLALAVLFSFAACDNTNNTQPDDNPDTPVDTTDYAYLAVQDNAGVKDAIESVATKFAATTKILDQGKFTKGYSLDLANNTLTFEERTAAVEGLGEVYTVITVSGKDASSATDTAAKTKKTIILDRYTVSFAVENPYAIVTGDLTPITGEISGDMIGKVVIDKLTNNEVTTSTTIAISPADVDSEIISSVGTGDKNVPTAVVVFYPDEASDIASLSYVGHGVDAADFVAYLNSDRTNSDLKNGYAVATTVTSNEAYKEFQEEQYGYVVYNTFNTNVVTAASGLAEKIKEAGVTSQYTEGTTTSSATFTYTNNALTPVSFVDVADGVTYALPAGGSVTVTFEGRNDSAGGSFTASSYSISGTFGVYSSKTLNDSTLNKVYDEIVVDLEGDSTLVVKKGAQTSSGIAATLDSVTFAAPTDGTIATTINANVLPGVTGTADKSKLNVLGEVVIDCPVADPNAVSG